METGKSTTPSFASCEIRDAARPSLDFELPDGEGFASLPPQVTLETVMQRSRQLRLWFPQGIPTAEERWQAKTDVEFKL